AQAVTDPELYRWLENILLEGKSVYNEEHEILFPREHQLIVHVKPLEVGHEPVRYFLICLVDITGMGSREKEKNVLGRIQSLLRLSKGIAHELGNPLNSIAIHLKLLGKMCESVSSKEKKKIESALEVLTQETGRLDRIVKNFLKATRQIPPQFKVGNIHEILEEALRFFGPEMKQYKIKLKTEFAPSMPPFLFDRDKMHQVFLNLIKNAVEAMPNGGELKVKTAVWQKVCSIAFQDNGFGISEDDMPHIFEDYYTTKEEGSGLGLAIVYNIVREHGGRIDVKSAPRKGTLMILYMPIRTHKLQIPEQTL
ncbi:MAG: hypothetical protein HY586_05710, partial [Candidatus Omnitrophica bacterium]|nr:hypothetical protein [Candidatus Omnitrophota bacterium]